MQQISAQRTEISELTRHWQKPLAIADSGLKVIRALRNHPSWVASVFAALMAWRLNKNEKSTKPRLRLAAYPSAISTGYKNLAAHIKSFKKR